MTANRLKNADRSASTGGGHVPQSREEWLEWCWERNRRARAAGWRHWLYVIEQAMPDGDGTGTIAAASVNGDDAGEVWQLADDKPLVPHKWSAGQVRQHLALIHARMRGGMTRAAYDEWRHARRTEARKAWVDARVAA